MSLSIDGQEVMSHKFDTVKDYFNKAYIGLGLWDGEVAFQNVYLTPLNQEVKSQGWFTANQAWYYRKADGQLETGLADIDGQTHYFNADGSQVKGDFASPDGGKTWYYLDKDNGQALTGGQTIAGKRYTFDETGQQIQGRFVPPDGGITWYYLDKDNGLRVTGRQVINGEVCYFDQDGRQLK